MTAAHRPQVPQVETSITLDADLVDEFDQGQPSTSFNAVLRTEKECRDEQRHLGEMLQQLAAERGLTDPAEVASFDDLLQRPRSNSPDP